MKFAHLGMIVFNNTNKVIVYNPDKNKAEYISAKEGTVIIDNTLLESNLEGRYRFTMAHEGAHWILHRHIYQRNTNQISFFDNLNEPLVKCRSTSIDGKIKPVQLWDDNDTMEWQANYMSSAILMPKSMIFTLFKECGFGKNMDEIMGIEDFYLSDVFSKYIAAIFNVSFQAAKIRLKNLGIIKTEDYSQKSFLKGRIINNYINNKIANNF
ncbi:MAG: ImmA/IrrE family metallo-endopeptidase [Caloramator sp.]|nr:ImmA/IrrE family metallo-endopeptidase [Caloramator sp.]